MLRFILILMLFISGSNSFANCIKKEAEEPKRRCGYLEVIVQYVTENMELSMRVIMESENIPESAKTFFQEEQERFQERVQKECEDNLECKRDRMVKRIGEMKKFYCDYHECKPPKPLG